MSVGSETKKHSILKVTVLLLIVLCVFGISSASQAHAEDEEIAYQGIANREVRVRTGPGTEYDQVVVGNKLLYLSSQTECVIIGQDTASNGKEWYKIRYTIGDEEIEGFVFAEYVGKFELSPTEAPTPMPTSTPTPTPTNTPTPTPTAAPVVTEAPKSSGKGTKIALAAAIIAVIVGGGTAFAIIRRKKREDSILGSESTKELARLNKLKLENSKLGKNNRDNSKTEKAANAGKSKGKNSGSGKQIKIKKSAVKDVHAEDTDSLADMPVTEKAIEKSPAREVSKEVINLDTEAMKESSSKELEQKRILRADIEALSERDIVIHKIFGEGEVFDNSDVKLIEIRFGNDARFLNKDQLAAKRLLEETESGEVKKRVASRRSRRVKNDY